MTDDWSLKGRELALPMDFISYSLLRNSKKVFMDDTIDTLREKLIEDIRLWFFDSFHNNSFIEQGLHDIINKRFGVD